MLDAEIVGYVIQHLREQKRLSQEVLSSFAGIGRTHLSAIERGQRKPTLETFFRISEALDMKASDLMAQVEAEMESRGKKQTQLENKLRFCFIAALVLIFHMLVRSFLVRFLLESGVLSQAASPARQQKALKKYNPPCSHLIHIIPQIASFIRP